MAAYCSRLSRKDRGNLLPFFVLGADGRPQVASVLDRPWSYKKATALMGPLLLYRSEIGRRRLLLLVLVIDGVDLDEALPFLGQVLLGEDRLHRAFIDTEPAIDARLRINVEHLAFLEILFILRGMDAVHRAD